MPSSIYRTRLRPRSHVPFAWYATDGLDNLGRLMARTGQEITLTRGGTPGAATATDSNGRLYVAGVSSPRFHYINGVCTLLREGAGTNSALGACSFADGTYWGGFSAFTVAGATSCIAGQTAYKHTDAVGNQGRSQGTGVFVNAQTDCFSWIVENDTTVPASTTILGIYDTTAVAFVHRVRLTWATKAMVTLTGSGTSGAIDLGTGPNGGALVRVYVTATGTAAGTGAAGNTRTVYIYPAVEAAKATITHHSQFEAATSVPSSVIVTVAAPVTRAADLISVPWSRTPEAGTFYMDAYDLMGAATGLTPVAFYIGVSPVAVPLTEVYKGSGKWTQLVAPTALTSTSAAAAEPAYGDRVELRPILAVSGGNITAQLGQSINGAAEVVAAAGTARAISATWGTNPRLHIGTEGDGTDHINLAIRSLLYVPGPETSLATFRSLAP